MCYCNQILRRKNILTACGILSWLQVVQNSFIFVLDMWFLIIFRLAVLRCFVSWDALYICWNRHVELIVSKIIEVQCSWIRFIFGRHFSAIAFRFYLVSLLAESWYLASFSFSTKVTLGSFSNPRKKKTIGLIRWTTILHGKHTFWCTPDHHVKFEVEATNLNKAPHSDFYYFRWFILKWNAADFGMVGSNL